jgi:hypothetical protein
VIGNGTGDDGRASVEGLLYCGEDEDVEGAVL